MQLPIKRVFRSALQAVGYNDTYSQRDFADPDVLAKASIFVERYREIVSDPLNLLIKRVPDAGYVDRNGCVILHNGNRVPVRGEFAYYGDFSDILIINRGVHEPLEEFCFQTVLKRLGTSAPRMIELGAYWAHYSMWLMKSFPSATCIMVEPNERNIHCGRHNFNINGYNGEFIQAYVGSSAFEIDKFVTERNIRALDILHSDIQGYEVEMIQGAQSFLSEHCVSFVFVSTHSERLHCAVVEQLLRYGYRIEVSSGFDTHTTSCDGFVLASSPNVPAVFNGFSPLGRVDIAKTSPGVILRHLTAIIGCVEQ